MAIYVGLDVSQRVTEICVIDGEGHRLWRGQCASDPADIATMLAQHAPVLSG
jgi:transposase